MPIITKKSREWHVDTKSQDKVSTCPFCGKSPTVDFRYSVEPTPSGHFEHYAIMERCCPVLGRRVEYFTSKHTPNISLWRSMCETVIRGFNRRV